MYLCRTLGVSFTQIPDGNNSEEVPTGHRNKGSAQMWPLILKQKSRIHLIYVGFFHKFTFMVLFPARLDPHVLLLNFNYLVIKIDPNKGAKTIQWGKDRCFSQ